MSFEVKLCCEHFVTIFTLEGLTLFLRIRVFFSCFFLINIGVTSHEIANLGNSFTQILHFISSSSGSMLSTYNSSSVYVLECIIL